MKPYPSLLNNDEATNPSLRDNVAIPNLFRGEAISEDTPSNICVEFFSVGSLIIDDIVLPDGETRMGILGGGAVHAAMGMRIWSERVGLVAPIGEDYPEANLVPVLSRSDLCDTFDLSGLQHHPLPTPRAWQVYEADGQRTEIFRTDLQQFLEISPRPEQLPLGYHRAQGVHLQCATPEPLESWIHQLRGCKLILWEPWDIYLKPENRPEVCQLLPMVDIFSPNLTEAQHLTGLDDPVQIIESLLQDGATCVALRMGGEGSLLADAQGHLYRIPVAPVEKVIDVTGAGNAYCGGLLVGLAQTGDLGYAGQMAAVSASFALEQFGALFPLEGLQAKAQARLAAFRATQENPRRRVFDRMASEWDARPSPPDLPDKLSRIVQAGELTPDSFVLDLGCGTGSLLPHLLPYQPAFILALDISPTMLNTLRANHMISKQHIHLLVADGEHLPLQSGHLDAIFCNAVFPHFQDHHRALSELRRALRPGGRLVIGHAIGRDQVNAIHRQSPAAELQQDILPTAQELATMLENSGWNVQEALDKSDFYLVVART